MIYIKASLERQTLTKRTHGKIMRLLMRNEMTRHVTETLPKHFENNRMTAPGGSYGYAKRSLGYQRRKARQKGHTRPNVWSGALRRKILSTARATIRATQFKATSRPTGTWVASNYKDSTGNPQMRPLLSFRPELKKEIEAVSPTERRDIARRMEKQYARYANDPRFHDKRKSK
ncbi:MAG TPA: hypothetical protein VLA12_03335 [Planctomycetaceae bacterium]|nr:hypothetical protein [Planctomycetaceae bacterium]